MRVRVEVKVKPPIWAMVVLHVSLQIYLACRIEVKVKLMSPVVEPPLSRGIRQLLHTLDVPLVPAVTARPPRFLKSTSTKVNGVCRGVHLTSLGKKLENKSRARSKKKGKKKGEANQQNGSVTDQPKL
jgi:hypothetical protein